MRYCSPCRCYGSGLSVLYGFRLFMGRGTISSRVLLSNLCCISAAHFCCVACCLGRAWVCIQSLCSLAYPLAFLLRNPDELLQLRRFEAWRAGSCAWVQASAQPPLCSHGRLSQVRRPGKKVLREYLSLLHAPSLLRCMTAFLSGTPSLIAVRILLRCSCLQPSSCCSSVARVENAFLLFPIDDC
jgi:hypothetical protein